MDIEKVKHLLRLIEWVSVVPLKDSDKAQTIAAIASADEKIALIKFREMFKDLNLA